MKNSTVMRKLWKITIEKQFTLVIIIIYVHINLKSWYILLLKLHHSKKPWRQDCRIAETEFRITKINVIKLKLYYKLVQSFGSVYFVRKHLLQKNNILFIFVYKEKIRS